jgi:hypothetical protein
MVRHVSMPSKSIRVGRKRIARLMRQPGVSGVNRRKFVTTMGRGDRRQAPDLVERNFTADRPDRLWVARNRHALTDARADAKQVSKNRATIERERRMKSAVDRAHATATTPLDVMMTAMARAWKAGDIVNATKYASDAAPYTHPRLTFVDATIRSENVHFVIF